MSVELWYTDDNGDIVQAVDLVPADTLEVSIHAAEASVGESQITIDDPDGSFNIRGHRLLYLIETEAQDDDWFGVIGPFYSWNRTFHRGPYRTGAARIVTISVKDINTLLSRRVQKGNDAERDAETDIERMEWLMDTAEVVGGVGDSGLEIEDRTFFFEDTPSNMSESNYRGVESAQVVNDCMQQTGKNAYLFNSPVEGEPVRIGIWYGRTEREEFASPHKISNVLDDISPETLDAEWMFEPDLEYIDGLTFSPSIDAELDRDPSRVYSGAYVNWDGGYSYQTRTETREDYAARDGVFQAELVKSQSAADARARRYVRDLRNEDDAITCSVLVPAALVHAWVPGHRVQVKFSHLEGYEDWTWMRVAAVTYRHISGASKLWELALDLRGEEPPEIGEPGGPAPEGDVFAVLNRPGSPSDGSGGVLWWGSSGDNNKPGWPHEPSTGGLSIITDPTPVLDPWPYTGILVSGDGTLDRIEFLAFTAGIPHLGTCTVTWAILQNGAAIASGSEVVTGGLYYWSSKMTLVATNITVADGDVIEASVTSSPPMPYFRVPSGTGGQDERLRIIGGSLT